MPPARVHATGDPAGPTVVLVHGIGVSGRYFRPLERVLARTCTVLTVDLPGFGGTSGPRSLSIPQHAEAVLAALGGRDVAVLVGHSMGCQVVAAMLEAVPGAAAAAVLIGPTVDDQARSRLRQGWRLARDSAAEPPGFVAVLVREYAKCGPRRYLATAREMVADRIEEHLPAVRVPVLVVRGENDPIAPQPWVERLARTAPRGRSLVVPGARHGAQWSQPERVAAACLELVREQERS